MADSSSVLVQKFIWLCEEALKRFRSVDEDRGFCPIPREMYEAILLCSEKMEFSDPPFRCHTLLREDVGKTPGEVLFDWQTHPRAFLVELLDTCTPWGEFSRRLVAIEDETGEVSPEGIPVLTEGSSNRWRQQAYAAAADTLQMWIDYCRSPWFESISHVNDQPKTPSGELLCDVTNRTAPQEPLRAGEAASEQQQHVEAIARACQLPSLPMPSKPVDSTILGKTRAWLQARFLERAETRNIVSISDASGTRKPNQDDGELFAAIAQKELHDFLISIGADLINDIASLELAGWLATMSRVGPDGVRTFYRICPEVMVAHATTPEPPPTAKPDESKRNDGAGTKTVQSKRPRKGKGGKPPLSKDQEDERLAVLRDWWQAYGAGIGQKRFCRDRGITLKQLRTFVNWHGTRQSRNTNSD